jgi:hypothetical protein
MRRGRAIATRRLRLPLEVGTEANFTRPLFYAPPTTSKDQVQSMHCDEVLAKEVIEQMAPQCLLISGL